MALPSAVAVNWPWPAPSGSLPKPRSLVNPKSRSESCPGPAEPQRLPRLVGKGRALQLILSGEIIDAQEAYRIGLVNEVVPAANLISRAEAILNQINANAPLGVKFSIDAVNKGLDGSVSEGLSDRGIAIWDLCRIGRQEGRHIRLPGETSAAVPGTVRKSKSQP